MYSDIADIVSAAFGGKKTSGSGSQKPTQNMAEAKQQLGNIFGAK